MIDESASIGENSGAYRSCSLMMNGEAVIFGGNLVQPINIKRQVHFLNRDKGIIFIQISVVSECTVKRLGDLPFDFTTGACGTFIIDSLMTILLCFSGAIGRRNCRSLTRRNNNPLTSIEFFDFDTEFEVNRVSISDSKHSHLMSSIANYQGFPLVLGGTNNVELEMLDTRKSPLEWVQYEDTDYPYLDQ